MGELLTFEEHQEHQRKILELLADKYPTKEDVYSKLIFLQSRLALPKGTEHFMSDLHGEYEGFFHILNNCSGVIREKVDYVFGARLTEEEKQEFCTLIYYPHEKIEQLKAERKATPSWYHTNLSRLLELSKLMSYKTPASKMQRFIPAKYSSIIVELMTTRPEADDAQLLYLKNLLSTITAIDAGADFIEAFTVLIKRLAVDRLHIVGDFFDRGGRPDAILNLLMEHPSVDIQWGNHDVLWMGAALGSVQCIATVVRNCLRYKNTDVLERGYGISLRPLLAFAARIYPEEQLIKAGERAITTMLFKTEKELIDRNPDFHMESRLLLHQIDFDSATVKLGDGKSYALVDGDLPTVDPSNPYALTQEEEDILQGLRSCFIESPLLQKHLDYLYQKGSAYNCYNGNLLFHGCVPMEKDGTFREIVFDGKTYSGRAYFDYVERRARKAYHTRTQSGLDFMYFLWYGRLSPLSGREIKTFERALVPDEATWKEPSDPYFKLMDDQEICEEVLRAFGLSPQGHIINGHVPVKVKKGETPLKAHGKAIVIDGGFCRAYHKKTGISGYTLVFNSRGLRLLEHQEIADVRTALKENRDIESVSSTIELQERRMTVGDSEDGRAMQDEITDLYNLLQAYQSGLIKPRG